MSKERILIVYDVPGWCWHYRALGIMHGNKDPNVEIDAIPQRELKQSVVSKYHAVLVMSWPDAPKVKCKRAWTFVANEGTLHPYPPSQNGPANMRTASKSKNIATARKRLKHYHGVININPKIQDELSQIHPNVHFARTGVDNSFWVETVPVSGEGPITIGWSGKSFDDPKMWTPKGYHEVLVPLMSECKDRFGSEVFFEVNRNGWDTRKSATEQRTFYNMCDVFLVTSCSEGTPSSLLEAMSCGRPFIATDVGMVESIMRLSRAIDGDNSTTPGLVVPVWSNARTANECVNNLVDAIEPLVKMPRLLLHMAGAAKRVVSEELAWHHLACHWIDVLLKG